jgi:hypothetical protein
MIAGNGQCRGFMVAVAVLIVLLTLLLFFAWSRKRNNSKPEPPLHTAALGSKNSDVDLTCTKPPLLATDRLTASGYRDWHALVVRNVSPKVIS